MKKYQIVENTCNEYRFIIFLESSKTPLTFLDEISKELNNYSNNECKVIFDMLLSMGNTAERYAEALYDGEKFINSTFKYIKVGKKDEPRKKAIDILNEKPYILENSILNSVQKKMISKGIVI